MFEVTPEGFRTADGEMRRHIELEGIVPDKAWMEKQEASIDEYLDHNSMVPAEVETLYGLFDGFIAVELAGLQKANILDVGCGIRRDWPHYARSLKSGQAVTGNTYVGLDPLTYDLEGREYPFIAGRLEDLRGVVSSRFDVFLFATSLDHFQDLTEVASSVVAIAKPGAVSIFWVGVHDPSIVAEQTGSHIFRKLFGSLHPGYFFSRYLAASVKILLNYFRLLRRRAGLLSGRPLDDLHFHYFTERNLRPSLELFGRIERYLHVPGTNSIFASVRHR